MRIIYLSHERCKIIVFEIARENCIAEYIDIFDDKSRALFVPADHRRKTSILNNSRLLDH